jgi:phosphoribosylformylglycinamidine synthase subunit PurQ / glutaminase
MAENSEMVTMKPKVLVLTGYGINCDYETQHAFNMVGGDARRVHINDIIGGIEKLEDYQIMAFPGGFSFGDDIASGKVLANKVRFNLFDDLKKFIDDGKLVIGICNGFQVMVKMGLLPAFDGNYNKQVTTLTFNDSGKFEDRWVYLRGNPKSKCVFTRGINDLYLPVRHGEGKFITNEAFLRKLEDGNQIALRYVGNSGNPAGYPWNPNGSQGNIAGICDETGRVFGLMPHPEAHLYCTNHPRWTRGEAGAEGAGVKIFRNAVAYIGEKF